MKASHSGTGGRSHGGHDVRCSTCWTGEHHSHQVDSTCPCWCGRPAGLDPEKELQRMVKGVI